MNRITNHQDQRLNVWKKEPEQPELTKQGTKADGSKVRDSDMANDPKDIVEIRNPLQHSIESNRLSRESNLKDVDEAQKLLQEVVGLLNSENDKSQAEHIYDFNQENLVQLLS